MLVCVKVTKSYQFEDETDVGIHFLFFIITRLTRLSFRIRAISNNEEQEALHQERERGGGGVARDRIRHQDTKEQSEVNKCNANFKPYDGYKLVHSILQYYTCQIIPLSAKRWNFNILYIFISIPEKV